MTENISLQEPSRGLSANTLKTIAIIAMLIDHIAHVFVPGNTLLGTVMHSIGRITGPVMFYFVAEGYFYTRNANRYTLRLALFAVISYLPFIFCFYNTWPWIGNGTWSENWFHFSVIYTILLGFLAIRVRHEVNNRVVKLILIILLICLSALGDWAVEGVFIMIAFDYYRGDFKKQAFAYGLLMGPGLIQVLTQPIFAAMYNMGSIKDSIDLSWLAIKIAMFLPLFLLSFYNGQKGRTSKASKWGFYIFYPLHLTIIGFVYLFLNK